MDDSSLFDEVLRLTLARQAFDATDEQFARLERLLADNQEAVVYYLQIVTDGLTIRELAEARASISSHDRLDISGKDESAAWEAGRSKALSAILPARRFRLLAASLAFIAAGAAALWPWLAAGGARVDVTKCARVVNISGVEWADGAKQFSAWSYVAPGEILHFQQGIINLFLNNGVELLIEGPADVRISSLERIVVTEGRLAARVGPDAIGFSIETPHANIIDRGTSFGISVDRSEQTDVVVYDGIVDLDVLGQCKQARRRLETGEGLRVNSRGALSRITSVQGEGFLSPPQVRSGGASRAPVIAGVSDNIRLLETAKYNRVISAGFGEDCQAYVDRQHEWNGIGHDGLPPFLLGGDYVMTFNEDKTATEYELTVELAQPANLYVLIDNRVPPPTWLIGDFVDTNLDVGLDEIHPHVNIVSATGAARSIDQVYSIWHREMPKATSVVLGPLGSEKYSVPARVVQRGMYGVVATPLHWKRTSGSASGLN